MVVCPGPRSTGVGWTRPETPIAAPTPPAFLGSSVAEISATSISRQRFEHLALGVCSVLGAPVWVALASAIGPCEVFGAPDIALARCKGFWSVRIHRAYTLRRLIIVAERIDSHNPPDPVTVRRAVIVVVGLAVTEPRERSMEFGELPLRDGLRRELMRLAFHSGAADNERGPYPVPHG